MKDILKFIFPLIIIIFFSSSSNAQNSDSNQRIENTISLGYIPYMVLDIPNLGLHAGYNVAVPLTKKFYGEAQLSYSIGFFEGTGEGFFDQAEGNYQIVNVLFGGRLYFKNKEYQKKNTYLNLLLGYSLQHEEERQQTAKEISDIITRSNDFGFSIGLYRLMKNNFSLGIAFETGFTGTLKVGYTF